MENPLFSQASMSAAAAASSRRASLNQRINSRHEDAVGCTHMQMHVVVQRRAEAVQE
jgi:hypothetical protein